MTGFDIKLSWTIQHERLSIYGTDISDEVSLENSFDMATSKHGPISVCVAAAGRDLSFIPHHKSMADMSLGQWDQTIKTNLTGSFLTARAWMRGLRDLSSDGTGSPSLILFSSEAASMGVKGNPDYSSSKAGLQGLVVSLAPDVVQLHPRARVNAVAPGPVDTPQFRKECLEDPQVRYVDAEATVAQRRPVSMESVAQTCLFLASKYASSITGQIVHVNGGKSGKVFYLPDGTPC